jgi:hypothetical protein
MDTKVQERATGRSVIAQDRVQSMTSLVRKRTLLSLGLITPLGFLFKLYAGPGHHWLNNSAVGVLYVIFWCLILFLVWPRREWAGKIAVGVLVATSLLEVLQLWHPWPLELVRATFLGRALLGTTFTWLDFPYYALGSTLGWLWMRALSEPTASSR